MSAIATTTPPCAAASAAVFKVGFPSTSQKILGKKSAKLDELGAAAVVTSCPGCYMQLQANLDMPVHFFSDLFEK